MLIGDLAGRAVEALLGFLWSVWRRPVVAIWKDRRRLTMRLPTRRDR